MENKKEFIEPTLEEVVLESQDILGSSFEGPGFGDVDEDLDD